MNTICRVVLVGCNEVLFSFGSMEELTAQLAIQDVTDVEIYLQYIEGDDAELFALSRVRLDTIEQWFDDVEGLDSVDKAKLYFLICDSGLAFENALQEMEQVSVYEGPLLNVATELFDSCYGHEASEFVLRYIDYESFARDCRMAGELYEFTYRNKTYTAMCS